MCFALEKHISEYLKSLDDNFYLSKRGGHRGFSFQTFKVWSFKTIAAENTLSAPNAKSISAEHQECQTCLYLCALFPVLLVVHFCYPVYHFFLSLTGCFFPCCPGFENIDLPLADPCTSLEIFTDHCLSLMSCVLPLYVSLEMHSVP